MVGAYSASKFALEALSDTLRVELRPWGIPVSLVRPGQIRTPIFEKARKQIAAAAGSVPAELQAGYGEFYVRGADFNERGSRSHTTPERVAQTIRRALEARWPRPLYVVGLDAWAIQRLIDRCLARVMGLLKNG
jgi:NAD(P)-dependent dehydrogenase (short-subunit alcohol dehydrogenase family)